MFPEQPAWSKEFANSIPYGDDLLEDYEIDDVDYETELEGDDSDYEREYEEEYEDTQLLEPIHFWEYTLSELQIPENYYSIFYHG